LRWGNGKKFIEKQATFRNSKNVELKLKIVYIKDSPDLELNSTCWDFKHNAKGGK